MQSPRTFLLGLQCCPGEEGRQGARKQEQSDHRWSGHLPCLEHKAWLSLIHTNPGRKSYFSALEIKQSLQPNRISNSENQGWLTDGFVLSTTVSPNNPETASSRDQVLSPTPQLCLVAGRFLCTQIRQLSTSRTVIISNDLSHRPHNP